HVARNDEQAIVRRLATENVTDPAVLKEIAADDEDPTVRNTAKWRLSSSDQVPPRDPEQSPPDQA
ncbi:MAG: hypothetical protein V3T29_05290, partial [Alphaproteobacteria bacterium]